MCTRSRHVFVPPTVPLLEHVIHGPRITRRHHASRYTPTTGDMTGVMAGVCYFAIGSMRSVKVYIAGRQCLYARGGGENLG
eukprot:scaffold7977_cov77-Cyclotella_meneghiniana.AAC.3